MTVSWVLLALALAACFLAGWCLGVYRERRRSYRRGYQAALRSVRAARASADALGRRQRQHQPVIAARAGPGVTMGDNI